VVAHHSQQTGYRGYTATLHPTSLRSLAVMLAHSSPPPPTFGILTNCHELPKHHFQHNYLLLVKAAAWQ
jgi:hypothetical protein